MPSSIHIFYPQFFFSVGRMDSHLHASCLPLEPMGPCVFSSGFPSQESPAHAWTVKQPHHRDKVWAAGRVSTQNCWTAMFGPGSLILTWHGFLNYSETWSLWVPSTSQVLKICCWSIGAQSILALGSMGRLLREQANTRAMIGTCPRDLI